MIPRRSRVNAAIAAGICMGLALVLLAGAFVMAATPLAFVFALVTGVLGTLVMLGAIMLAIDARQSLERTGKRS